MVQKIVAFDVALKSTERQWVQKVPEVYTNDLGSVSIQFKVTDCTDVELTNSTAIVLLKMRDGSFFQGPSPDVGRTLNVFSYNLKENEGNHDGLAEIQLVVTIAGKAFGTQKYNFKVISGLDSEVAREIMIYDWSTLTAEARAYIDQFTADELLRDAEFDNAQFDRNAAFNSAQTQRVIAFNSSEAARVNVFNSKETARAAGYDADHERASTDHTGATTDRTNAATDRTNAETDRKNAAADRTLAETDHTRAEADHTRADTDSATVAGFNARMVAEETATANNKISAVKGKTFADVDARFEDVEADTTLMATNLVTNGDFSNGTTGWYLVGGTGIKTVANNELTINYTSFFQWHSSVVTYAGQQIPAITNNKYYMKMDVSGVGAYLSYGNISRTSLTTTSAYTKLSTVFTAPTVTSYPNNPYSFGMNGNLNTEYKIKNFVVVDLTTTFGEGNEPTLAEMDRLMARFPNSWFDGVKSIQTIEQLYQEKAGKTQEAWITPTLLNGWASESGYPVKYMKDNMGFVHLKGALKGGTGGEAFVLPSGYRPLASLRCAITNLQFAHETATLTSTGYLYANGYIDNITFRAEG